MQPIIIIPQDVTDLMFLHQHIGEGEYDGQPVAVSLNLQSGDWVVQANGRRWALPLADAIKQMVEQMFAVTPLQQSNQNEAN